MSLQLDKEKIKRGVRLILEGIGVDLNDENFKETPDRFADFLEELLSPKISVEDYKYFTSQGDLVIMKDIEAYTLCPHHLLPVHYRVYIAYIPRGKVVGVSKLARAVLDEARRLGLQEQFTEKLAQRVQELTESNDVMVVVKGVHYCMRIRGVKSNNSQVVTSAIRGKFRDYALRMETLRLMGFK